MHGQRRRCIGRSGQIHIDREVAHAGTDQSGAIHDRVAGIVTVGRPLNVSGISGRIADAERRNATCALPITNGCVEKRLLNFTRSAVPPSLMNMFKRSV